VSLLQVLPSVIIDACEMSFSKMYVHTCSLFALIKSEHRKMRGGRGGGSLPVRRSLAGDLVGVMLDITRGCSTCLWARPVYVFFSSAAPFAYCLRSPRAIPARTSSYFVLLFSFPLLSFARVSCQHLKKSFPLSPRRPSFTSILCGHCRSSEPPSSSSPQVVPFFFSPSPHPLHSSRSPPRNPPQPRRDRAGLAGVRARRSRIASPFPLQGLLCSVSSPGQYFIISLYIF
jgi:hypothetical protein